MTDNDIYKVECSECGYERRVETAKYIPSETSTKRSAQTRKAAHISNNGCSVEAVTVTRIMTKCKQCGERIENNNQEFCSLSCRVKWYRNQNTNETE